MFVSMIKVFINMIKVFACMIKVFINMLDDVCKHDSLTMGCD
mgnify:CR=1 FL=1